MNYLVERALDQVSLDVSAIEEALRVLRKSNFSEDTIVIRVLNEKLEKLQVELKDLERLAE